MKRSLFRPGVIRLVAGTLIPTLHAIAQGTLPPVPPREAPPGPATQTIETV